MKNDKQVVTFTIAINDNYKAKGSSETTKVKKLIQMALVPNKKVLQNMQTGKEDELSTYFKNMTDTAFE